MARPTPTEASPYYFTYINQVEGDDVIATLKAQLRQAESLANSVSEDRSLFRPAPGKWSIREVLGHINDAERLFAFRAFWFARGLEAALPSFDQEVAARYADSHRTNWAQHMAEFRRLRATTIGFFEGLPEEAWSRAGVASETGFTVRALAFIIAGHFAHHLRLLNENYRS